jgi:hypothetical protein
MNEYMNPVNNILARRSLSSERRLKGETDESPCSLQNGNNRN